MARRLAAFLSDPPGYFREGEEETFPWASTGSIWYALLCIEDGKLAQYGFTASKTQKANLLLALQALGDRDDFILLGVWPGQWKTHLFLLEPRIAKSKLRAVI